MIFLSRQYSRSPVIIKKKLMIEGKDLGRVKFVDPTTFTRYKGYIQHRGQIETEFYREMLAMHWSPTEPEMIFVPILQTHHWHLLIAIFNVKALTTTTTGK